MMRYLIFFLSCLLSLSSHAVHWADLWFTPDQQGQKLMQKNRFKEAKETFKREDWSAAAAYRAGDYQKAANLYQNLKNEQGYYNLGNTLAHLGQYEQAIKAYDQTLTMNAANQDAVYNRKLVEELLKKDKNKDQQNKDQQDKDQQDKEQQDKEQQNKEQQNKEQQQKEQQQKEQQQKEQQQKEQQQKEQQQKEQQQKEQQQKEQQQKEQQQKEQQQKEQQQKEQQSSEAEREKQQAKEQWLRLIPDDPGGLMKEKFLRDHLRRQGGWDS